MAVLPWKMNLPPSRINSAYLRWHKSIEGGLYSMDVDTLEIRKVNGKMRVVAIIELQDIHKPVEESITFTQSQIYPFLAHRLGVPLFIVRTNIQLDFFTVKKLYPKGDSQWISYSPEEYEEWLRNLK